jgi:hypothetical protein
MTIPSTSAAIMALAERLYTLISDRLLNTLQARVSGVDRADEFDRQAPATRHPSYTEENLQTADASMVYVR